MAPDVKICGLTTRESILAAVGAGATHVGFVFFPKSPRNISLEAASGLRGVLPSKVKLVALLVDAPDALTAQVVAAARPDVLQLHGQEGPERVAEVRRRFGLETWKAMGVRTSADVAAAQGFAGAADLLLFDAKPPTPPAGETAVPGGTGVRFDWRLVQNLRLDARWGLAGGLDAQSVGEAIRLTRPHLVDVSSGVEDAPGVKSVAKIEAFIKAARNP
ncbi:phosphoribosylanthranilate isomerase [Pedomonas mirosovicensis]|uniref:phosphoribosylanthranilate isomerase n=1 Tax=Pedomonas mirosovicensis TaxID=2908641 RepID=UPI002167DFF9|nr:phosphoribosylanthranilate isomerase [Pedomonas mirosovicensis]MCH8684188.1 phosphoribosylanthranilate isomerase [Pedomonas mirosovicensis]